jgi:hypothetical protein
MTAGDTVTGPGDLCMCGHIRHEHDQSLRPDGTCFADMPTALCDHFEGDCPYPDVCHCNRFEAVR